MRDWLAILQVAPPANDPLMIGQLRDWLEITDNSNDAKLIGLIKAASLYVQKQTGLRLFTQTVAMRRAGFAREMQLPVGPVQSITSVQYRDAMLADTLHTLPASTYAAPLGAMRPTLQLATGQSWPSVYCAPDAVTVTAVVGFGGVNDMPEDIRLAMMLLCTQWFDTRSAVSEKAQAEIPNGVRDLLADYSPSPLA